MEISRKIEQILAAKWFLIVFCVSLFYFFLTTSDRYIGWTNPDAKIGNMVRSDGACYYGYLPQWFIYHTDNFEFISEIDKKYPKESYEDNYFQLQQGKFTNKYFCGTALVCSPFFGIGHIHAKLAGADQDGYSWPYILWINLGSITYGVLGMLALILIGFQLRFKPAAIYLTATAIAVGTNLFYYVTVEIPYSHVFCFAANTWAFYSFLRWKDSAKIRWKLTFFVLIGLALIIRPTNILVVALLPFVFSGFGAFWVWLKAEFTQRKWSTCMGIVLFLGVVSIQFFSNYQQTGDFTFNNYQKEGFDNWADPYFWNVLFGFNKGMFVYSPVLLLMIPGMFLFFRYNRYMAIGFWLVFILTVYIISAWWCWWYGGSFGLRALTDFYGIYALALMVFLNYLPAWGRGVSLLVIALGIYVFQVFDTQFKNNIIRYDGMDYNQFRYVFLKTQPRYQWILYRNIDTLSPKFEELQQIKGVIDPKSGKRINYFSYENKTYLDLPSVTIDLTDHERYQDERFAYKLNVEAFLHNGNAYLSVITKGYFNNQLIFEKDNPYGQLPATLKRWEPVELDVSTDRYVRYLDSVQVIFNYTSTYSEIRNPVIHWGFDPSVK